MLVIIGRVDWIPRLQIRVIIDQILLTLESILSIWQHLQLLISFLNFGLQRSNNSLSIFNLQQVLNICNTHIVIILTNKIQQLLILNIFLLSLLSLQSLLLLLLIQLLLLLQLLLWVIFIVLNVLVSALHLCLLLVWLLQLDLLVLLVVCCFLLLLQ